MDISVEHRLTQARERFAVQDYYGAAHLLEELLGEGQAFADVHHLLGLARSMLGHHERAVEAFDAALRINPRYLEAHIHRGIVLNELGRSEEAEEAFRTALSHHPDDRVEGFSTPVASALANQHAALGQAYADAGALRQAVEQLRRAVELGPAFHDLRYRLARLLLEAGQALAARDELERIVDANPDFLDAQAALGLARYLSGDPAGAREIWKACLTRRPGHARVSAYLAMANRIEG